MGAVSDQGARPDNEAFTRYVVPELEVLLRVARSLTGNIADAEDLVQDVLIRAYRGIGGFDGRYPRAWLLTILRNTHINRVRSRHPEPWRDPESGERLMERGRSHDSPETLVVDQAFEGVIEEAFTRLPERFQRVVELVDIDGLSYQEAADVLDVPVGTVMSRLHRSRRRIRHRITTAGLVPRRYR